MVVLYHDDGNEKNESHTNRQKNEETETEMMVKKAGPNGYLSSSVLQIKIDKTGSRNGDPSAQFLGKNPMLETRQSKLST